MESLNNIAAIIGFMNGVRLWETDKKGFYYFLGAIFLGILMGYLGWLGISGPEAGFIVGLASSGYYRIGQNIGGK